MPPHNPLETRLAQISRRQYSLDIAGTQTAVWDYGDPDAPQTFLLVHGFRGTHHGLQSLVSAMPEARFIAPDLPGFGESEPFEHEHTLAAYGAWLVAFTQQVDPDARAHVLGHSFGSMVVATVVEQLAPRRIVLVNPISENALSGPDRILTGIAIAYYRIGALLPRPLGQAVLAAPWITRIMSEVMAVTRNRALRQWIHAQHRAHFSEFANRRVLLEAFKASVSDDVISHADSFPEGTVLVVGEKDAIAPVAGSRRLQAAMPGSKLYVIAGVGHLIHYETPVALARVLRESFLP